MKILFTTPILEHPARGGPQLRIENSIKALSKICELHIIYRPFLEDENNEKTSAFFQQHSIECKIIPTPINGSKPSIVNIISERLFNKKIAAHSEYILNYADSHKINTIWFGFGNISYPIIKYIKHKRPSLKLICDTDSVWSRFILRELPYASDLRKIRIKYSGLKKTLEERQWVNLCDVTTAVSEVDSAYYKGIARQPDRIRLFSNVVDMACYNAYPQPSMNLKQPSIYLAGTFGHYHSPMDTAARWVIDNILPRLIRTHPNIHLYIVGRDSERGFGHLNSANITVTGQLDSVLPYLYNATAALVPLKFESGTRFKILEAGACKVPIVSTTLGAEGLPVVSGKHLLIADTAEDFTDSIVKLIENTKLASELATNCHALVQEHFSIDSLILEGKNILEFLRDDRTN